MEDLPIICHNHIGHVQGLVSYARWRAAEGRHMQLSYDYWLSDFHGATPLTDTPKTILIAAECVAREPIPPSLRFHLHSAVGALLLYTLAPTFFQCVFP